MSRFARVLVDRFHMLWFLFALGLGGTSVAGFAFLNYVLERPEGFKGLVHQGMLPGHVATLGGVAELLHGLLSVHIGVFAALHLLAMGFVGALYLVWRRRHRERFQALVADNTRNATLIAPALALGMTFNVMLVGGYFYFAPVRDSMQALMPYALAFWMLLFVYTMSVAVGVQKRHLETGFDVLKMHFGWLLMPFALGMLAVSGAGVAALAEAPEIAKTAFFLSLVPFSMASFLLLVKLVSLFRSQYRLGKPEKVEFLPSFLIVIPIATLLAITLFRYGHFFDHQLGGQLPKAYFALVTAGAWAFELWYAVLGLALLGSYIKDHLFNMRYFDESQWGLICPMVALSVLGSFVHATLLPSPLLLWTVVALIALDVAIVAMLSVRQFLALVQRSREEEGAGGASGVGLPEATAQV